MNAGRDAIYQTIQGQRGWRWPLGICALFCANVNHRKELPNKLAEKLKIIPLGGLDEIGKNCTVLEYGKDMIVIDCGVAFPDEDMYGVDLVIPDFTYLVQNEHKLKGFFITHGHEDHIGSIPYAMQQVHCPVHGTAMTNGLIKLKLEEHGLDKTVKLITHKPGDIVKAGCFSVEFIHVNHSIADAVAFCVNTPVGRVIFTGDFKIDPSSADGMTDLARLGQIGNEGVLALLADSTNVERPGITPAKTWSPRIWTASSATATSGSS